MQASSGTCGRTGDGNLLIHRSSTNGIILATLKRPAATHYATPFSRHPATPTEPLDFTSAYQVACLNGVAPNLPALKCRRALTLAYRRK